jgi:hypothetical protein
VIDMKSADSLLGGEWAAVDWSKIDGLFDVFDADLSALARAVGHDPKMFFRERVFFGLNLRSVDVRGIDFTRADLRGTNVSEAIVDDHTVFTDALLDEADINALAKLGFGQFAKYGVKIHHPRPVGLGGRIARLETFVSEAEENRKIFRVSCALRFATETVFHEGWRLQMSLEQAEVIVSTQGCTIVRSTELPETPLVGPTSLENQADARPIPAEVSRRSEKRKSRGRGSKLLTFPAEKPELFLRIIATGPGRWRIREPHGPLSGDYFSANRAMGDAHPLCLVEANEDAFSVQVRVVANVADFRFDLPKFDLLPGEEKTRRHRQRDLFKRQKKRLNLSELREKLARGSSNSVNKVLVSRATVRGERR